MTAASGLAAGLQPAHQHQAGSMVASRSFLGALMDEALHEYDLVFNGHNNEPDFNVDSSKRKIYSNKL